jgi:hypothetical protein
MKASQAQTQRRVCAAAAAMAALAAAAVLFAFDPATAGFYPVCPLHQMTGLECPGCGGLRAAHQLLHGHLDAAWHLNPIVVLLVPVMLWLGLREVARELTGRTWPGIVNRPAYAWVLAAALVLFGILRNVPLHRGP